MEKTKTEWEDREKSKVLFWIEQLKKDSVRKWHLSWDMNEGRDWTKRTSGSSNFYVDAKLFWNKCGFCFFFFFNKKNISGKSIPGTGNRQMSHGNTWHFYTDKAGGGWERWTGGKPHTVFIYFLIDFKHLSKYTRARFENTKWDGRPYLGPVSGLSLSPKGNHSYAFLS